MLITQEVLYHVLTIGLKPIKKNAPKKMESDRITLHTNIDLSEVCNGVVNPITKETLTNYKKFINCPALRDVWLKAMCK